MSDRKPESRNPAGGSSTAPAPLEVPLLDRLEVQLDAATRAGEVDEIERLAALISKLSGARER